MGKLRVILNTLLGVTAIMTVLGCGPEESTLEQRNKDRRSRNEKMEQALKPFVGIYEGELTSPDKVVLRVRLNITIYTYVEEGREAGEENSTPKLQSYLAEYKTENPRDELPLGLYFESSYDTEKSQLILFNKGEKSFSLRVNFTPGTENSPATLVGTYVTTRINQIRLTRVQE